VSIGLSTFTVPPPEKHDISWHDRRPATPGSFFALSYLDLELSIGMLMPPVPIVVPISPGKPVEVLIFSMAFLNPHTVGLVLAVIPFVFVLVSGVTITTGFLPMIVVRGLRGGRESKWCD
jgi:hypothetical protein